MSEIDLNHALESMERHLKRVKEIDRYLGRATVTSGMTLSQVTDLRRDLEATIRRVRGRAAKNEEMAREHLEDEDA